MSEIENVEKLMNNKNVEFREFHIAKIETRNAENEEESLVITGVAATFEQPTTIYEDSDFKFVEKIARGAFDDADMEDVIFNYNHCGRVYARTRNNTLKLEVKEDGLHMEAELWADDEGHKQLYNDVKRGNIDKMSFAFTVDKVSSLRTETDDGVEYLRTIEKFKRIYDVSAVDFPAYNTTEISARKAFELEKGECEAASQRNKAASLELQKMKLKLKLKMNV